MTGEAHLQLKVQAKYTVRTAYLSVCPYLPTWCLVLDQRLCSALLEYSCTFHYQLYTYSSLHCQTKQERTNLEKMKNKYKLDSPRGGANQHWSGCSTMATTDGVEGLKMDTMVDVSLLDR